jgi:hypothetical protein
MWTREVQDVIFAILMCGWLGGLSMKDEPAVAGKLLTIEEVGEILDGESETTERWSTPQASIFRITSQPPSKTETSILYALITLIMSQFRSTSKTEMPSTSPSKNTSNHSLPSLRSLHD